MSTEYTSHAPELRVHYASVCKPSIDVQGKQSGLMNRYFFLGLSCWVIRATRDSARFSPCFGGTTWHPMPRRIRTLATLTLARCAFPAPLH